MQSPTLVSVGADFLILVGEGHEILIPVGSIELTYSDSDFVIVLRK